MRLKQFDRCLIRTQSAQDVDISNFKDSLAGVFNISFRRIDSPAIRMQADKLFSDFFRSPSFYWWVPRLTLSQSMPDLTSHRYKFRAWNMIDKCVRNVLLDTFCQCALRRRDKLHRTAPKVGHGVKKKVKTLKMSLTVALGYELVSTMCSAASRCVVWECNGAVIARWHWDIIDSRE